MRKLKLLLLVLIISSQNFAQQLPRNNWNRGMELRSLEVEVKADAFIATTFIQMEFCNPTNQEIEGLYTFRLLPHQVITAFQLDLHGKFRDGSIEEKWRATNAYNTIVGKRIDPALLSMTSPGNYTLNIYPVPVNGCRKITMTITESLRSDGKNLLYDLPFDIKSKSASFRFHAEVMQSAGSPATKGLIKNASFRKNNESYNARLHEENVMLNQSISFTMPLSHDNEISCAPGKNGQTIFALRYNSFVPSEYTFTPKSITIFWDASSSAKKRDREKEISFLKRYVSYHGVKEITIVPFNYKSSSPSVFVASDERAWTRFLNALEYESGTQLGSISIDDVKSDAILLFSDGINSYGKDLKEQANVPVYTIQATSDYDPNKLKRIRGYGGGSNINLTDTRISEAVFQSAKIETFLLDVISSSGKTVLDQAFPVKNVSQYMMTGVLNTKTDTLIFKYGNSAGIEKEEKLVVTKQDACGESPIDRLSMLQKWEAVIQGDKWMDQLEFGITEKIVTMQTSYIVLERVEDYIRYNITPPKELEDVVGIPSNDKYNFAHRRKLYEKQSADQMLAGVAAEYNRRIGWWDGKASQITQRNAKTKDISANSRPDDFRSSMDMNFNLMMNAERSELNEVVVVGMASQRKRDMTGSSQTVFSSELQGASLSQALAGKVSGLTVTPGINSNAPLIRLRGNRFSIGDNQPLYIIDGMQVSGHLDELINVNDIDNISVLKESAAAAMYGSRGANGAIVITTKAKRKHYNQKVFKHYKLSSQEDVEYLREIRTHAGSAMFLGYESLKAEHGDKPNFYIDMAIHFHKSGYIQKAISILTEAGETANGDEMTMRAVGYVLESWKNFEEAALIYSSMLDERKDVQTARDLALAYYQAGKIQRAVNTLYDALFIQHENKHNNYMDRKSIILNDLNAIVAIHQDEVDVSFIPQEILRPLPVDLRIVVDFNSGFSNGFNIKEPDGKVVTTHSNQKGGIVTGYYNGGMKEYTVRDAKPGKYIVQVQHYDQEIEDSPGKPPYMLRIVTYRDFAGPRQNIKIENVILNNQYGMIDVAEINVRK